MQIPVDKASAVINSVERLGGEDGLAHYNRNTEEATILTEDAEGNEVDTDALYAQLETALEDA